MRDEVCRNCGKVFGTTKRGKHLYCSVSCRDHDYRAKYFPKPAPQTPRECVGCGKVFTPKTRKGKWCSRKCFTFYEQARHRVLYKPRDCPECGAVFTPRRSTRKYCSQRCVDRAKHRKNGGYQVILPSKVRTQLRKSVADLHGGLCWVCKKPLPEDYQIHHLDCSDDEGKDNTVTNLVPLHRECHREFHHLSLRFSDGQWSIKGGIFKMLNLSVSVKGVGHGEL